MAFDGPGGRAGHAADCARATLHVVAHERQRGPLFRKVSVAFYDLFRGVYRRRFFKGKSVSLAKFQQKFYSKIFRNPLFLGFQESLQIIHHCLKFYQEFVLGRAALRIDALVLIVALRVCTLTYFTLSFALKLLTPTF